MVFLSPEKKMGEVVEFVLRPKKAKAPTPSPEKRDVLPVVQCSLCSSTTFFLLDDKKGGIACAQCRHRTAAVWDVPLNFDNIPT